MDLAPDKFSLAEWMPVVRKVLVLLLSMAAAFGAGSVEEAVTGELRATEGAVSEVVRTEGILEGEYENQHEMIRYYSAREAACDSALESFSRHRDDDRDWEHVIKECHSDA